MGEKCNSWPCPSYKGGMKKSYFFLFSFCTFPFNSSFAIANPITADSLEQIVKSTKDTSVIRALLMLSEHYQDQGQPEKAMERAMQALTTAEKLHFTKGITKSLFRQGMLFSELSDFQKALDCYNAAIKQAESVNEIVMQAQCLEKIGGIYRRTGRYPEGLTCFFKALKIYEKLGQENEEKCMMGIGVIYSKQRKYSNALVYLFKGLKTSEKTGNLRMKSRILINLGVVYYELKLYEKSIDYYKRVLVPAEKLNDLSMMQASYSNIGGIYIRLKQYEKGYEYCSKALKIAQVQGDKENMVITTGNIGNAYDGMKKYELAEKYYLEALQLSKEIGIKDVIQELYNTLSDFYEKKGDYKKSHIYYKLYSTMKDTLLNKENSKLIAEMETKYQTEKKQKQIEFQQLELSRQKSELNKQRIVIFGASAGLCLLLLLAFLLYNRYQLKQRANRKLQIAYGQIEEKNKQIEETNLQITDSIEYAKRIQESILPDQENIKKLFPQSFILFKPRDLVSGDFYWYSEENDKIIVAVVDCTGHGVPGAFMSMIGNTLLNEIVNQKKITDTALILELLNDGIVEVLHQDKQTNARQHDGMEIGICAIDHKKKELCFSGSRHNLYLFANSVELTEVKGDRDSIGGMQATGSKKFISHIFPIPDGLRFYLSSDGFMDQSGGTENKRLTSSGFKTLLMKLQKHSMEEQGKILESEFMDWKGSQKQKDDVLVVGIQC